MVKESRLDQFLTLVTAWFTGLFCIGSTLHGKWLNFPLSQQLRGSQYSVGPYHPGALHHVPWSFGVLAAGLMFVALLAFTFRLWRPLAWIGAVLLLLTFYGAFKMALTDPRLLQTLGTEQTQQQSSFLFTQQAMPVNYGSEPSVWAQLDLSSVEARLIAAWYFVHFGWWAALLGSLLALGYGAGRSRSVWIAWTSAAATIALLAVCAARPLLGEMALMRGHALEAKGDYDAAVAAYREAMRVDGWQALAINTYAAIGGVDAARGRRQTTEYHVFHAELASTQSDLPAALAELHAAEPAAQTILGDVIRKRESELNTLYARALHSLGAYGAASSYSEEALACDPLSLLPAYYLARDEYLVGAYRQAADLSARLLLRLDDPEIRANLFSNIGDAETQLGDHAKAKLAYRNSYQFDYVLNLRALSALNGPGRDLQ